MMATDFIKKIKCLNFSGNLSVRGQNSPRYGYFIVIRIPHSLILKTVYVIFFFAEFKITVKFPASIYIWSLEFSSRKLATTLQKKVIENWVQLNDYVGKTVTSSSLSLFSSTLNYNIHLNFPSADTSIIYSLCIYHHLSNWLYKLNLKRFKFTFNIYLLIS